MLRRLKMMTERFRRCESGATVIEYVVIAAGISIAIVIVVGEIGTAVETDFTQVRDGLN